VGIFTVKGDMKDLGGWQVGERILNPAIPIYHADLRRQNPSRNLGKTPNPAPRPPDFANRRPWCTIKSLLVKLRRIDFLLVVRRALLFPPYPSCLTMNIPEFFRHYHTNEEIAFALRVSRARDIGEAAEMAGFYAFHHALATGVAERLYPDKTKRGGSDESAHIDCPAGLSSAILYTLCSPKSPDGKVDRNLKNALNIRGATARAAIFFKLFFKRHLMQCHFPEQECRLQDQISTLARGYLLEARLIDSLRAPILPEFFDDTIHRKTFLDIGFAVVRLLPSHVDLRYAQDNSIQIGTISQLREHYAKEFIQEEDDDFCLADYIRDNTDPLVPTSEDALFIIGKTATLEPNTFCDIKI